ncbi:hypothetical protein DBV15_12024, partial [Temnothorax longispinosus]
IESVASSNFEIKKRKLDFIQSDSSSESSCITPTPIILDTYHVAEQENLEENYDVVLNDIDLNALMALNKEVAHETEKEDTTSPAVHLFSENSDIKDNYVYKILINSVEGKNILAQYKRVGLDNNARLKVAYMIIVSEFGCDTHKIIDTKRFHFLANEIEKLFPGELKDTYYIPSYTPKGGKTVQARGKLIDKYNTIARSLRENGIRSLRPGKSINTIPPKQNLPATDFLLESEKHLTIENCLEFLSTRLSPWDQIERYWKHTSHVRLNKLQLGTTLGSDDTLNSTAASQEEGGEKEEQPHALKVCNYFQIYKCLKQPLGYTLLEYDFSVLHPEASMRMVTHWNEFRKKVKIELEKFGEHHKDTDAEILCGLPSLFSVVPIKVPKGNWRPNRAEIRQGFLLHLQTITDLEKITKSWKKDLVKKGLALQPFPFVVGDDLSSVTSNYVYIDGEIILLESPTRAVEKSSSFIMLCIANILHKANGYGLCCKKHFLT